MSVEWQIIYLMSIFMCAYFCYQAGKKEGINIGIESTLTSLEAQGVIELEDEDI
jgi:hypothetical protein